MYFVYPSNAQFGVRFVYPLTRCFDRHESSLHIEICIGLICNRRTESTCTSQCSPFMSWKCWNIYTIYCICLELGFLVLLILHKGIVRGGWDGGKPPQCSNDNNVWILLMLCFVTSTPPNVQTTCPWVFTCQFKAPHLQNRTGEMMWTVEY